MRNNLLSENKNIEVLFYYDGRQQYARPISLNWQDETYDLAPVEFWYAEHKGDKLVHHYMLSDRAGNYTFQLALETENLTWTLEWANATQETFGRWPNRNLVGVLS